MKLSVGVFFGGCSTEHEVSVISAVQAMHALDAFYTTKQGVLYTGEALLQIENYRNIPALLAQCTQAAIVRRNETEVWAVRATPKKFGSNDLVRLDLAFPIVHGTNTEDGLL